MSFNFRLLYWSEVINNLQILEYTNCVLQKYEIPESFGKVVNIHVLYVQIIGTLIWAFHDKTNEKQDF